MSFNRQDFVTSGELGWATQPTEDPRDPEPGKEIIVYISSGEMTAIETENYTELWHIGDKFPSTFDIMPNEDFIIAPEFGRGFIADVDTGDVVGEFEATEDITGCSVAFNNTIAYITSMPFEISDPRNVLIEQLNISESEIIQDQLSLNDGVFDREGFVDQNNSDILYQGDLRVENSFNRIDWQTTSDGSLQDISFDGEYIFTDEGEVLDPDTGENILGLGFGEDSNTISNVVADPIDDEALYFTGEILNFDVKAVRKTDINGNEQWTTELTSPEQRWSPPGVSVEPLGERVYVAVGDAFSDPFIAVVNSETGDVIEEIETREIAPGGSNTQPILASGYQKNKDLDEKP